MNDEPKVYYHRLVSRDVREAIKFYAEISPTLAATFRQELEDAIAASAKHPSRCHIVEGFRRLNLRRFPYHVLFREVEGGISVMVIRHNKRHPKFGISRA